MTKKNLTPLHVREKISNFRGWEKILTQTDLPLRLKSQMVNHIGGGEKEDLTP